MQLELASKFPPAQPSGHTEQRENPKESQNYKNIILYCNPPLNSDVFGIKMSTFLLIFFFVLAYQTVVYPLLWYKFKIPTFAAK